MNIITIQFPQSLHHTNGMIGSQTDWELTALGIEKAHRIARKLKDEVQDRKFVIYSSNLKRCRRGAKILASYLDSPLLYDERLREVNLGSACGKSVEWFKQHKTGDELTCDSKILPDAESRCEAWLRLEPFYRMIEKSGQDNVIIYSHGGVLKILDMMHLEMKPEDLNRCSLHGKSGRVSFLTIDRNGRNSIQRSSDMWYVR